MCSRHYCCSMQVMKRVMVTFCHKQLIFCDGHKEDVIAIYLCEHGVLTCKVGFLPTHLNCCTCEYDGLVARVMQSTLTAAQMW